MNTPEQPTTTALIIGASGMLAECVRWCSERFGRVVATCHTSASAVKLSALAPNVIPVRADWSDPDEWWRTVSDTVGETPVVLAVIWTHSTAGDLHQRVHDVVPDGGLLVRIRGHATAKPDEGELASWIDAADEPRALPDPNERHIMLGWHRANGGQWLTADEIGSGVVQLVDRWLAHHTESPVAWVGSVRPWKSRPSGWS